LLWGFHKCVAYTAVVVMAVSAGVARERATREATRSVLSGLASAVTAGWLAVRALLLFVAAMVCFVVAAFAVSLVLGFVVSGVVLLVAEWRVSGG